MISWFLVWVATALFMLMLRYAPRSEPESGLAVLAYALWVLWLGVVSQNWLILLLTVLFFVTILAVLRVGWSHGRFINGLP